MSFITAHTAVTCDIYYDATVSSSLKQQIVDMAVRHVPYTCPLSIIENWCHLWLICVLFSLLKPDATCDRHLSFSVSDSWYFLAFYLSLHVTDSWYYLALHLLVTDTWYYTWPRLFFYSFLIADNTYDLHFSFSTRYWHPIPPCPSLVLSCFWHMTLPMTYIFSFYARYWQLILPCPSLVLTRFWQLILPWPLLVLSRYWHLIPPCLSLVPSCFWHLILPMTYILSFSTRYWQLI
jgi:hypothetical protein